MSREIAMPSQTTQRLAGVAAILGAALLLSSCEESHLRLAPDFTAAVNQDAAAQIADPDARYAGVPNPGSDGSHSRLAQTRYKTGKVIQPVTTQTQQAVASAPASAGADSGGGALGPQ
jgi:hypothetical protein